MKIHEVMVNNAYRIYLSLHFLTGPTQTARVKVVWNINAADNSFDGIARSVRIDDNFLRTDSPSASLSNG